MLIFSEQAWQPSLPCLAIMSGCATAGAYDCVIVVWASRNALIASISLGEKRGAVRRVIASTKGCFNWTCCKRCFSFVWWWYWLLTLWSDKSQQWGKHILRDHATFVWHVRCDPTVGFSAPEYPGDGGQWNGWYYWLYSDRKTELVTFVTTKKHRPFGRCFFVSFKHSLRLVWTLGDQCQHSDWLS